MNVGSKRYQKGGLDLIADFTQSLWFLLCLMLKSYFSFLGRQSSGICHRNLGHLF